MAQDAESPDLASSVRDALEPALRLDLLPKSVIDLFITVLECDAPLDNLGLSVFLLPFLRIFIQRRGCGQGRDGGQRSAR